MRSVSILLLACLILLSPYVASRNLSPLAPAPFTGSHTRANMALEQRVRAAAADKARVASILATRQTSFKKISSRRMAKKALELVRRACTAVIYGPKTSGKVYPTCDGSFGTGYARYAGW
jgi:hypothetical protein